MRSQPAKAEAEPVKAETAGAAEPAKAQPEPAKAPPVRWPSPDWQRRHHRGPPAPWQLPQPLPPPPTQKTVKSPLSPTEDIVLLYLKCFFY